MCEIGVLSLNLELTLLAKLAGQWAHEVHLSPTHNARLFMWAFIPETQVLTELSLHPYALLWGFLFCFFMDHAFGI